MNKLGNYITGRWITGDGDGQVLYDAVTGDDIAISRQKDWILLRYWTMEGGLVTLHCAE